MGNVFGIENDYKIIPGFNNADSLTPIQWVSASINGGNYFFPIPEGLAYWQPPLKAQATGGRIVQRGYASTQWKFPWLAPEMLDYARTNWQGKATIRTAPGVRTHANYNAVLFVPDPRELGQARILRNAYDGQGNKYVGPGWANVFFTFNRVEAL